LLSSSYFISDEDLLVDFHMTLATARDSYSSIGIEMQTASEMSILDLIGHPETQNLTEILGVRHQAPSTKHQAPGMGIKVRNVEHFIVCFHRKFSRPSII
jgi:hypothetical protein